MIISASYKTDIPAFYGAWFMNRLDAGYCRTVNPYGGQVYRVDLDAGTVDGFVFWTKNLGPFLPRLEEIRYRGFPFVVQYSITGYPRALEFTVCDADRSARHVNQVAERYGPRAVVWRYDPILFTSLTPAAFHLERFESLATEFRGKVDEVVISFAHIYKKTLRRLNDRAATAGFSWEDPGDEAKRSLAAKLVRIAGHNRMRLTVCSQFRYVVPGAGEALCVDAGRLSDVAGKRIQAPVQGNRPDCRCHRSRDIGEYDTCPHGCVYCYAVSDHGLARNRFRSHDPGGEFLREKRT